MKSRYSVFIIILLSFFPTICAQGSSDVLCRILDLETKSPISFATIKFAESNRGIIADEDGEFRWPMEYKASNRKIIVSSIGFESLTLETGTLKTKIINIIYLKPKVEALSTVLISGKTKNKTKRLSVKDIIKEAIDKIDVNYPRIPHSYMAYYRDYQIVNKTYCNLNEAILENFDAGFNTDKLNYQNNNTVLYSYNLNKNFNQDTLLLNSIYGKSKVLASDDSAKLGIDTQNELEILNIHNPIRNYDTNSFSFIYVFKDDFIKNHRFKLLSIKYVENIPLYEIEFFTKDDLNSKYMATGKIYIAKFGFAIHKIEYYAFVNANFRSNRFSHTSYDEVTKKTGDILFEVKVEYKAVADKMFLNYMTFNNKFIIKEPNPFRVSEFEFDPNNKAFYVFFNKSVDKSSIKQKNRFRLFFRNRKLVVKTIKLVKHNVIKIEVLDWAAGASSELKFSDVTSEDFSYKIKKIKDTFGAVIDKESKLIGYQFREFFTQEIFEEKPPPSDKIFVMKNRPLSFTNTNKANFNIDKYWVNSPLKSTKTQ